MNNQNNQTNSIPQPSQQLGTIMPQSITQREQPVPPITTTKKENNVLLFIVVLIVSASILGTGAYWFVSSQKKAQVPLAILQAPTTPTTNPSPTPTTIKTLTQVNIELNNVLSDDIDNDFASIDKEIEGL